MSQVLNMIGLMEFAIGKWLRFQPTANPTPMDHQDIGNKPLGRLARILAAVQASAGIRLISRPPNDTLLDGAASAKADQATPPRRLWRKTIPANHLRIQLTSQFLLHPRHFVKSPSELLMQCPSFFIFDSRCKLPGSNSLAPIVNFSAKTLYFVVPECFGTNTFFRLNEEQCSWLVQPRFSQINCTSTHDRM
jgi:hypothetical protein